MKRFTGIVLVLLLVSCLSVALAQRVECSAGGFSVKLPDHFVEEPETGDPDLCFYWHGNKGMNMLYSRTEEYGDVIISYNWMDRGNSVTMEFTYSAEESSVLKTVNSIINSIQFDAGH